ncbi:MAG: efflux RND transporter periplasmic adaptor subunit [Pyrinomonadaceae bacterium]
MELDTDAEPEIPATVGQRRKRKFIIIGAVVLIILVIGGVSYWLYSRQYESTDDAFVDADITQVSPKVSAYVQKVHVDGNQYVHKGDLLVELNPQDYQIRVEQAKAQLDNAKAQYQSSLANVSLTRASTTAAQQQARSNVQTATSNVDQTRAGANARQAQVSQARRAVNTAQANLNQTRAQVPRVESDVRLAQVEYDRRSALFARGDISRQSLDQALNALQTAQANLNAANRAVDAAQSRVDEAQANARAAEDTYRQALAQINVSQSQVGESQGRLADANAAPERIAVTQSTTETAQAQIAAAQAALDQAQQDLESTKIVAPEDGFVTRKTVEEGQLVQVGTPLMAISQSDDIWVVANFKETQLENMQVGQKVTIGIDAYPNKTFHGHIDSFQAGTGSRFSLLPAENATGNYVKVVQRIPVKIVFDDKPEEVKVLAPGMSAEPTVKVR